MLHFLRSLPMRAKLANVRVGLDENLIGIWLQSGTCSVVGDEIRLAHEPFQSPVPIAVGETVARIEDECPTAEPQFDHQYLVY